MNTRRKMLIALSAGALQPSLSFGQPGKVWRVGFLAARSRDSAVEVAPFLQGMGELGYVESKHVQYEWRFADGRYERLRGLAEELVRLKVDLIVASSTPSTRAAQQATRTIPIVMISATDPVGLGFVASLARPGGNITGVSNFVEGTWQKQLDLLVETVPKLSRVAVLLNPDEQVSEPAYKSVQAAAQRHAVSLIPVRARTAEEIAQAFVTMKQERSEAVVVTGGAFFVQRRTQLAELAAKARLPAVYYRREYVEAGGLMSYGRNAAIVYRRAAAYVDKILKGAKPGDLPVEQPTVIELVINRKAAKALGVSFPPEVLVRADKIID